MSVGVKQTISPHPIKAKGFLIEVFKQVNTPAMDTIEINIYMKVNEESWPLNECCLKRQTTPDCGSQHAIRE
jgi:hypothetical protein